MANAGHEGQRVLVIDDDPLMQRLFSNILQHLGCQVLVASTGEQGIELALQHLPQLIILDYVMPDMDGLDTLKVLKGREETSRIPVLIATGFLDAAANDQFLIAGAAACLSKPFEAGALMRLVEKLLPAVPPQTGSAVVGDSENPHAL